MIAGDCNRFAIECELAEQTDRWLLGRFRFWLCGRPVGNWEDQADLSGCVRWLQEFANVPRNRFEPSLAFADGKEVFRRVYDPVIGLDGDGESVEDAYARFHISHLGMSSCDQFDLLLVVDEAGGDQVADVASVALTSGSARSPKECREISLQLIRWLLDQGLAEAGVVTDGEGFVPWAVSATDAAARIEREWVGEGPGLGQIGWLNLTDKGQLEAETLGGLPRPR